MKIIQVIELTKEEQNTVESFLKLVDTISDAIDVPINSICEYFTEYATFNEDGSVRIDNVHEIHNMR